MNILIVDDEVIAIEGIQANVDFSQYGIGQVYTATSVQKAKGVLQKQKIAIILCDIEMPGGTGLELLEWVRDNQPDIVSVILSCHDEFSFAQQAVSLSCMEYILKPATPDVLANVLGKVVSRVKQQTQDEKIKKLGEAYVQRMAGEKEEPSAVEQVQKYITEHIGEELLVEQLARMVYLSQNHLTRIFKKKYGKTVTEYIADYRMGLAQELLAGTRLTVTMISAKVGYPNYAYFSKQFKRYSGYTPSQYRNKFGKR